jgi:arylsulfatase A-like enzyme
MKPNVLFVILDTVRADSCSLYGRSRATTPGLDGLREESVVFDHAVAPSTWTLPSHGGMFTGRYPTEINLHGQNMVLSDDEETVAETLQADGYTTGVFSANPFLTQGTGLNRGFDRSYTTGIRGKLFKDAFDPAEYVRSRKNDSGVSKYVELVQEVAGPPVLMGKNLLNALEFKYRTRVDVRDDDFDPTQDDGAADIVAELEGWIDDATAPFFACANFMEAHTPYRNRDTFLPEWADETDLNELERNRWKYLSGEVELTDRRRTLLRALYEAEIRYLDEQLQSLWTTLRKRGDWDRTLVIVTSDHGEFLGEHGLLYHDINRLYEPLVHVPLLVKYPNGRWGSRRVCETTSLITLHDLIKRAVAGELETPAGGTRSDMTKVEFVQMNQSLPDKRHESMYADFSDQSRAVYAEDAKYFFHGDTVQVAEKPFCAEETYRELDPDAVPDRIVEFAAMDRELRTDAGLEVDESVENRLEQLGYR